MEIISGLINTPKALPADEIIPVLCDRLAHSSLSADRRAAVLTLKGFSREYRELVIANGLRGLIGTLTNFTLDTDIIKACLETLLILFIRGDGDDDLTRRWISQQSRLHNGKYPSPLLMKEENSTIDQFSLWIADEIVQENDTVAVIVSLLENSDFYVRLYTLQLLEALVSVRPVRAKEALLNFPLGISSLIQVLQDTHDPVRNEAILLLMAIANDNFNIQKLIAFENTFDRLFEIIHEEGDIRGSIVVQDCLSLITNLLKYNVSNQNLFLETNCLPKLAYLISEPLAEEIVWNDQRLQNITITLEIVKLFVVEGNESTKTKQDTLYKAGIFTEILKLSFSLLVPNSIRSMALLTTAELIDNNPELQFSFSSIDVPYIDPSLPQQLQKYKSNIPIIISLLNWCLSVNSVHLFDIRVAASKLLHAYFKNNREAKVGFIQDQITAYEGKSAHLEIGNGAIGNLTNEKNVENEEIQQISNSDIENGSKDGIKSDQDTLPGLKEPPTGNIFTVLLEYDPDIQLNPYKVWFSSVILLYIFEDDDELKEVVRNVVTGDEEAGEEVLTSIQAITDILVTTLKSPDPRPSIGYLILLIVWLFEDFKAVDDFLSDSSSAKALVTQLSQPSENQLVEGLIALLLGVAYEFSSKDSPVSRVDFHTLLCKAIGKDNFGFKIRQLKESKDFSNFSEEAILNPERDNSGLPKVFFDPIFVQLVKNNYNRIKNTLNKEPTLESFGRISYEKFEELRDSYYDLQKSFDRLKLQATEAESQNSATILELGKKLETTTASYEATNDQLIELKEKYKDLSNSLADLTSNLEKARALHKEFFDLSERQKKELQTLGNQSVSNENQIKQLKEKLEQTQKEKTKAEDGVNKMSRDLFKLSKDNEEQTKLIKKLEKELETGVKSNKKLQDSLNSLKEESRKLKSQLSELSNQLNNANKKASDTQKSLSDISSKYEQKSNLVNELSGKLELLTKDFTQLNTAKENLELKIAEIRDTSKAENDLLNLEIRKLKESEEILIGSKNELVEELERLRQNIDNSNHSYEEQLKELKTEYEDLLINFGDTEKDMESHKNQNEVLQKELVAKSRDLEQNANKMQQLISLHETKLKEQTESHKKSLSEMNSKLNGDVTNYKNEISKLEKQNSSLLEESGKLRGFCTQKEKDLETNQSALDKTLEDLKNVARELAELKDNHSTLKSSKSDLQEKLNSVSSGKDSEIVELKKQLVDLEAANEELENELDQASEELDLKGSEAKKEITILKEKIGSLEEQKKSLESTLEIISQNIEDKAKEYESLSKDYKTKKVENESLENKLTKEKEISDELRNDLLSLKESRDTIKDELTDRNTEVAKLESDLKKKIQNIDSLQLKQNEQKSKHLQEATNLQTEIQKLRDLINTKSQEFEKERSLLSEDSSSATKEFSEKASKLEEMLQRQEKTSSVKISVLQKQKSNLEESVSDLKSSLENMKNEILERETKIKELEKSFESKSAENQALIEDVKAQSLHAIELSTLRSEAQSLKSSKEALEKASEKALEEKKKMITTFEEKIEKQTSESKMLAAELTESKAIWETEKHKYLKSNLETESKLKALDEKYQKSEALSQGKIEKLEDFLREAESLSAKKLAESKEAIEEFENKLKIAEKDSKILEETRRELSDSKKQLGDLKERIQKLEQEVEVYRKENGELVEKEKKHTMLEKDCVKILEELEQSKKDNSKLVEELEALKSEMVPRTDLDDLMLVMSELEESKRKYKKELKQKGGDVSSDDDMEEDDH